MACEFAFRSQMACEFAFRSQMACEFAFSFYGLFCLKIVSSNQKSSLGNYISTHI
ncbi:hypothetical protein DPMN_012011 [Dreissena polymorpha]|uniref:Uncharacterized protein n=1 Tax=Dreissena polymorpha TaxID=45954 RepID=A0A9D4N2P1_DREPO|nr:hypothetical protein DPMN_012011 [Dreissena polymorpha]